MKRLIPAAILFVLVIVAYITSLLYITNSCDKTKALLDVSVTAYKENKTAQKEAKTLHKTA